MRNFWYGLAAAALLAGAAQAQYRDRYGNPGPYGDRDRYGDRGVTRDRGAYGNRGGYGSGYGGDVVGRALSDLDRVASSARWVDGHERKHFDEARKDLRRFQESASRGKFDRGRLDGAINHMSHLADARQLNPRDRQLLARDLAELRDFRSRGGSGYRGGGRW